MIFYARKLRWPLMMAATIAGFFIGPASAGSLPSGRYYSSEAGAMDFICRGYGSCEVSYDGKGREFRGPGKIVGKYSLSGQFVGFWIQRESKVTCDTPYKGSYNWGKVEFRFNYDVSLWEGYWKYCDDTEYYSYTWNGRRKKYW